jgi:hypothetical protein
MVGASPLVNLASNECCEASRYSYFLLILRSCALATALVPATPIPRASCSDAEACALRRRRSTARALIGDGFGQAIVQVAKGSRKMRREQEPLVTWIRNIGFSQSV